MGPCQRQWPVWDGKQAPNQPAAPWGRQPVTAGAGSGHLEASLICPAVCFGLVSLLRRSDVSQASASLSLDLLHTALANLGI